MRVGGQDRQVTGYSTVEGDIYCFTEIINIKRSLGGWVLSLSNAEGKIREKRALWLEGAASLPAAAQAQAQPQMVPGPRSSACEGRPQGD